MKTQQEIEDKISIYKTEICQLKKEIDECMLYQKKYGYRITRDCDYIKDREIKILQLNAKLEILTWI